MGVSGTEVRLKPQGGAGSAGMPLAHAFTMRCFKTPRGTLPWVDPPLPAE